MFGSSGITAKQIRKLRGPELPFTLQISSVLFCILQKIVSFYLAVSIFYFIFDIKLNDMKTIKVLIAVDIITNKTLEEVKNGLKRSIYKGLDSESNYIAEPKNVDIRYIAERD